MLLYSSMNLLIGEDKMAMISSDEPQTTFICYGCNNKVSVPTYYMPYVYKTKRFCCYNCRAKWLKEHPEGLPKYKFGNKKTKTKLEYKRYCNDPIITDDEIIRLYTKEMQSICKIARHIHRTTYYVSSLLKYNGVEIRKCGGDTRSDVYVQKRR